MPALSSTVATELTLAQLDAFREHKGTHACERTVRAMRKSLERFPGKMSALTPEKMETATARRDALAALSAHCQACGKCVMADL